MARHLPDPATRPIAWRLPARPNAALASLLASLVFSVPAAAQGESEDYTGHSRIVGGSPARPGQWLSMVALFRLDHAEGRRSFCGGTVIARRFVLTAAHCVDDAPDQPQLFFIREGATNLGMEGRFIPVRAIRMHPQYRLASSAMPPLNDVALLELREDATSPAQPLLAARAEAAVVRPGRLSTVIGFGHTTPLRSLTGYSGGGSSQLLQVDLPIVAQARCLRRYGAAHITPATICAGFDQGRQDSCRGDSGGPLFLPLRRGPLVQVGVVSWGPGCALPNAFGVYASVAYFEPWIRAHVPDAEFMEELPDPPAVAAMPVTPPGAIPPRPTPPTMPLPPTPSAPMPAAPVLAPPVATAPPVAPAQPAMAPEIALTDQQLAALLGSGENLVPSAVAQVSIVISAGERVPVGHAIRIRITSSVAGKLVVFNQNAEGKAYQIFPNRFTKLARPGADATAIEAGQSMLIPGAQDGFQLRLAPPLGRNRLIAIVMPPETNLAQAVQAGRDMRSLPSLARNLQEIAQSGTKPASPLTRAIGILNYEIVP
jgi:secreted trypsin-like serine protease